MVTAYIAANTLEALSMRVARRTPRGQPLLSAAEQLRTSLCFLGGVQPRDREIYLVATRRIIRSCARVWLAARRAGTVDADEHHTAREALIRVLATTPAPTTTRRQTRPYASVSSTPPQDPGPRWPSLVRDVELRGMTSTIAR
jgi:hypothetical protein